MHLYYCSSLQMNARHSQANKGTYTSLSRIHEMDNNSFNLLSTICYLNDPE